MRSAKLKPRLRHFPKDQVLFKVGDRSDFIYRVATGEANEAGNAIARGGFVGEIGVLIGCSRGATVTVYAGTSLETMTRGAFLATIFADKALAHRLLHSLSLRCWALMEQLGQVDGEVSGPLTLIAKPAFKQRCVRLLANTTARLAELLRRQVKFIPEDLARRGRKARRATFATFAELVVRKGELLFEEGSPSTDVFWIKSGVVHVTKRTNGGERVVGRPRPGEVVGEIGVIEALPRAATARAMTKVVVQAIPTATFHELIRISPNVYLQVIDALCERARFVMRELDRLRARERTTPGQEAALYQAICSMESVGRLAEQRFANELVKMRRLFHTQVEHGKEIVEAYRKHSRGEALPEELERANAHFVDYLKLAGLGTLLVLPGAPLSIPLASKMGKAMGIDIFPTADDDN